jgi:hypothetical protein
MLRRRPGDDAGDSKNAKQNGNSHAFRQHSLGSL